MMLYHGSLGIIAEPKILPAERMLDYGAGFYTTTSAKQAEMWVERKIKQSRTTDCGFVCAYECDESRMAKLRILWFDEPSEEWLDFVMANRTDVSFSHNYDIVFGPVADDRVYASFALYESGVYNKKDLIRELKTYVLVDQMLFHTERALELLIYKGYKEVKL